MGVRSLFLAFCMGVERRIGKWKIGKWNDLYGMGKGIWRGDDAQDYVNRAREERI